LLHTDPELLAALSDLREIEAGIARLQDERLAVRARLSEIVALRYENRVAVAGYGTLQIRAPGVSMRWDTGALTELVRSLREQGQAELADEIEGCKKRVESEGGLAITPEKKG
jgi:hypothetical protein